MDVRLIVLTGKHKGREIPLPPTLFVIGRGEKCHLRPHDSLVSHLHCAVARWSGRVLVRDLKSTNGTFLNGQRVRGEIAVQDGDVLRVGKLHFVLSIQAKADPPAWSPPVRESEVRWLMESPGDSSSLSPCSQTVRLPAPPQETNAGAPEAMPDFAPASGAVSAGQYLRDYLRENSPRAGKANPKGPGGPAPAGH
jgi:predicted component of type VI protein secretion system